MGDLVYFESCIREEGFKQFMDTAVCRYLIVSTSQHFVSDGVFTLIGSNDEVLSLLPKYKDDLVLNNGKVLNSSPIKLGELPKGVFGIELKQSEYCISTANGLCREYRSDSGGSILIPEMYARVFNHTKALSIQYMDGCVYILKSGKTVGFIFVDPLTDVDSTEVA